MGVSSKADSTEILAEAVATRAVFNGETAADWAAGKYAPDMASGVFVAKLMDETSAVRIATGNRNFKFNKTDGFRYISKALLSLAFTHTATHSVYNGLAKREEKP